MKYNQKLFFVFLSCCNTVTNVARLSTKAHNTNFKNMEFVLKVGYTVCKRGLCSAFGGKKQRTDPNGPWQIMLFMIFFTKRTCDDCVLGEGGAAHEVEDLLPVLGETRRPIRHQALALGGPVHNQGTIHNTRQNTCRRYPFPKCALLQTSVADPDPNPDPRVFGPPGSGSGSTSQRYGSGSFYHHAKIVRET